MNFKLQGVTCFVTAQPALWQRAGSCLFYVVRSYASLLCSPLRIHLECVTVEATNVCVMRASGTSSALGPVGSSVQEGEVESIQGLREVCLWASLTLSSDGGFCPPGNQTQGTIVTLLFRLSWLFRGLFNFCDYLGREGHS